MYPVVYKELRRRAFPLIQHHHRDLLLWDRRMICDNPGVPFLHWTRPMGTHIVLMGGSECYPARGEFVPYLFGTADREHILRGVVSYAMYHVDQCKPLLTLHYDGLKLREITPQQALEVARKYTRRMLAEWSTNNRKQLVHA